MTRYTFGFVIVLMVFVGIWVKDTVKTLQDDPLSIQYLGQPESYILNAGDAFTFNRRICVERDMVVTVHREFHNVKTNSKIMAPAINYGAYAKDGCFTVEFSAEVPLNMAAGEYEYRPILIYQVNDSLMISKPAPVVRVVVTR